MKQKYTKTSRIRYITTISMLALSVLLSVWLSVVPARADRFDDQITTLRKQNSELQSSLNGLQAQAGTYQDAINQFQAQINALQQTIDANIKKQNELQSQITANQLELDRQRAILSADIKTMYVDGQPTTIEMLATSRNLSDFIDKEEYRTAVQKKIQDTLKKINELQRELNAQKNEVDQLLAQQQAQQAQLDANRAERARLLSLNKLQQDDFSRQIKEANNKIAQLKLQQIIENAAFFGGTAPKGIAGWGGYPWGNAACASTGSTAVGYCYDYDWRMSGQSWDPWGYQFRNCTSWTAFRLSIDGKNGFSYLGNAATWPNNAAARGYRVDHNPGAGSAAIRRNDNISPWDQYGHVMYVESVNGDGSIIVSQYNAAGDGGGSSVSIGASAAKSLYYVHF